jgi:hypothetical protein
MASYRSAAMKKPTLDALNVLNWDYLCEIANEHPELVFTTDIHRALERFAYDFTRADSIEDQNEILAQLLENATFGHGAETNEGTVRCFAELLCTERKLLREFAKQEGIRLKSGD